MRKRFTSFVLIAALLGGALAGVHAHAAGHKCPMRGMEDCCATAHEQGGGPEVSAARLCCLLNCTESGTTGPTEFFKILPLTGMALYAGGALPAVAATSQQPYPRSRSDSESPPNSHPAYIRHLALLI
jgi:hypothetical protein